MIPGGPEFILFFPFCLKSCSSNVLVIQLSQVNFALLLWFQEWPEEDYPPYANGPGYILSYDVACYIVNEFEKHKLRVTISHNQRSLSLSHTHTHSKKF